MRLFALVILLLTASNALADVYVVSNPSNKEVYSLSDENDAVVPSGYSVNKIKGQASDYLISANANDYKFTGNKLTLNVQKVNDREKAKQDKELKFDELNEVKKESQKMAYLSLKNGGKTFKYISEEDFK